jgi:hypothetical protein
MAEYVSKAESQAQILDKIRQSIVLNQERLEYITAQTPVATSAWLARNLLELAIWAEYCRSSQERAQEFMLDGARDAYDALNIPQELLLPSSGHLKLRQELLDKSKHDGFDIEESYTKVANAAKVLDRGPLFRHMNKTLSKFAHPTAFAIFSLGSETEVLLKEKFRSAGLFFARAGLMFTDQTVAVQNPFPDIESA